MPLDSWLTLEDFLYIGISADTIAMGNIYLYVDVPVLVSGPRRTVIGRQRTDVIMRRERTAGHVLLLLSDVIVSYGRQVVVMQQPL